MERLPTESDTVHTINGTVIGDVERIVLEHVYDFGAMTMTMTMPAAVAVPARHRIEIHIVNFTNHDEFPFKELNV
ncbi:hypothetical protein ACRQ5Q_09315 [Bradyrhizobium sp. PMVTL-01]|uniref:hypothetical protein n=1 Tax=Bradyrhizobium sp. PMVTL-01 TaxID=3434999 RepID=UPI003F6F11F8